ncbi:alpha/beta hydrolase [Micromonospora sp. WMMD975]|uniref:alpha/beta hydrolase family protein n=1 Tax=Micromonospora sp. WMMD975 TaxID=3016087 RepID=UPI002499CBB5|nr:alpha/beta hydrolase [Micromonospora sp. WMMD975]WFE34012.1 alpha/beta hydrolase [Micromonospora sp. WMMD975]
MQRIVSRLVALALVTASAACVEATPAPEPTGLGVGVGCPALAGSGRQVVFGDEIQAELGGVLLGSGPTGVVLAHMAAGDVCQWLPYGRELADRGYRVLAFDFAGSEGSRAHGVSLAQQVTAAADALRADGASRVVLAGGSMGGSAVLAAAPTLDPTPVAVVALSPPAGYGDADALAAVPKITSPVFYGVGELETSFAESTRRLYDATPPTTVRQLVLAPTAAHGVNLVVPEAGGDVDLRDRLAQFLTTHAPPS